MNFIKMLEAACFGNLGTSATDTIRSAFAARLVKNTENTDEEDKLNDFHILFIC
jgi:hypothetical protein